MKNFMDGQPRKNFLYTQFYIKKVEIFNALKLLSENKILNILKRKMKGIQKLIVIVKSWWKLPHSSHYKKSHTFYNYNI